ncbi:soluble scavenger receptor cysteine-rich domain-containing protein SSC5D-like, partial [Gracilinanus agilis]|uniref:soluble scavenger receptor cysteine-rich domain-containing protein SSC5D-like n=1 Tax=Gracilinanus agilis TaxID=191870 RepID=UPI001CFD1C40
RLEVWHEGRWGTVCDDGWDLRDAAVACRELGCGGALAAPGGARFGQGSGPVWMDDVGCGGGEQALQDCPRSPWGRSNCDHTEDAGLVCEGPAPRLRLAGGPNGCAGRLEVWHEGRWGTVCDDGWDLRDAAVACRELGCGGALAAPGGAFFGEGAGPILLDDLRCKGNETSLGLCPARPWGQHDCHHREDAGAVCDGETLLGSLAGSQRAPPCAWGPRAAPGALTRGEGTGRHWTCLLAAEWTTDRAGLQAGLRARGGALLSPATQPLRPPDLFLGEWQHGHAFEPRVKLPASLYMSPSSGGGGRHRDRDRERERRWRPSGGLSPAQLSGRSTGRLLPSGRPATNGHSLTVSMGVPLGLPPDTEAPTKGLPSASATSAPEASLEEGAPRLRLVSGPGPCAGRLEVRRGARWGTVCDDGWDARDAAVACRELGCGAPREPGPTAGRFGWGEGPIWLDDVACTGAEVRLADCPAAPWGRHNCAHNEDVGVTCTGGTGPNSGPDPFSWSWTPEPRGDAAGWPAGNPGETATQRAASTPGTTAARPPGKPPPHSKKWPSKRPRKPTTRPPGQTTTKALRRQTTRAPQSQTSPKPTTRAPQSQTSPKPTMRAPQSQTSRASPKLTTQAPPRQTSRDTALLTSPSSAPSSAHPELAAEPAQRRPSRVTPSPQASRGTTQTDGDPRLPDASSTRGAATTPAGTAADSSSPRMWPGSGEPGVFRLRLSDGPDRCAGRLEVRRGGVWGTVCDDGWDPRDAAVACRELGCGGLRPRVGKTYYGSGTGPIWLDDVGCAGIEASLAACPASPWGVHNCDHQEDVGLTCTGDTEESGELPWAWDTSSRGDAAPRGPEDPDFRSASWPVEPTEAPSETPGPDLQLATDGSPRLASAPGPGMNIVPSPGLTSAPGPGLTSAPGPGLTSAPGPRLASAPGPGMNIVPSPGLTSAPGPRLAFAPGPGMNIVPSPGLTSVPSPGLTSAPGPGLASAPGPGLTSAPSPGMTTTPGPRLASAPGPGMTPSPGPGMTPTPGPRLASAPGPGMTPSPGPGMTTASSIQLTSGIKLSLTTDPSPQLTPGSDKKPTSLLSPQLTTDPSQLLTRDSNPWLTSDLSQKPTSAVALELTSDPSPWLTPDSTPQLTPNPKGELTPSSAPRPAPDGALRLTTDTTQPLTTESFSQLTPNAALGLTSDPSPPLTRPALLRLTPEPEPASGPAPAEPPVPEASPRPPQTAAPPAAPAWPLTSELVPELRPTSQSARVPSAGPAMPSQHT